MAMSEHNDKTLKPTPLAKPTKKILCKPKTDPLERKMQEDKQVTSETIRPKSWPNKMEVSPTAFIYLRDIRVCRFTDKSFLLW